jgi:glc operon protein GlcG
MSSKIFAVPARSCVIVLRITDEGLAAHFIRVYPCPSVVKENKTMKTKLTLLYLITVGALAVALADEHTDAKHVTVKHALTLDGAKKIAEAAAAYAKANGAAPSVAIVDEGGNLLYLARPETSFAAGANVSIGKARTAAIFKKPTAFFEDTINKGRFTMTTLPDFTPLQGGVPIMHEGQVIGAIGVSGAKSAAQDEEVAKAGAAVFEAKAGDAK